MKLKEQINCREVDRSWVNHINTNRVNLYPIQFANCDRMWWNDCVYIFDEVGSGKTISSGLMALDYLYNNRNNKRVLIITINALSKKAKEGENGQFLKDWFDKLPFEELNLERRITIINNHHSNILKLAELPQEFGLIIIDEAHLFSNDDTERTWSLRQLRAEKLVFMTATPFRKYGENLLTYSDIAFSILGRQQDKDAIMKILETSKKSKNELICSLFNVKCPVTRYFKDTIKSLMTDGYHKDKARRLLTSVWAYGYSFQDINSNITNSPKINKLINGINEIIDSSPGVPNRFIIFVRYVAAEASVIVEALQKANFKQFSEALIGDKSYAVVTGQNSNEMVNYKGNKNLPTVLIMTYQVAEQGVNLPEFNYIINYSISSDPSSLEQRFGRIDRMDSDFSEIHSVFLIPKDGLGIDFINFHTAFVIFLSNILSYLPSRNVIFTKEFVERFYNAFDSTKEYNTYNVHLNKLLEDLTEEVFFVMKENKDNVEAIEDKYRDLAIFCFDRDMWSNISDNTEFLDFKFHVKEEIQTLENVLLSKQKISNDNRKLIKGFADGIDYEIGDKIFYRKCDYNTSLEYSQIPADSIGKLDVIECGEYIAGLKSYQEYCEKFKTLIENPLKIAACKRLLNKHLTSINAFFEKKFMENDFDSLFEDHSSLLCISRSALKECIQDIPDLKEYDNIVMTECVQYLESILPLFRQFKTFGECLKSYIITDKVDFNKICIDLDKFVGRTRFNTDPFWFAMKKLRYWMRYDPNISGYSDKFIQAYWNNDDTPKKGLFRIESNQETGIIEASNWYKLAYKTLLSGLFGKRTILYYLFETGRYEKRTYLHFDYGHRFVAPFNGESKDRWTAEIRRDTSEKTWNDWFIERAIRNIQESQKNNRRI